MVSCSVLEKLLEEKYVVRQTLDEREQERSQVQRFTHSRTSGSGTTNGTVTQTKAEH